jgi:hypothetical protein
MSEDTLQQAFEKWIEYLHNTYTPIIESTNEPVVAISDQEYWELITGDDQ